MRDVFAGRCAAPVADPGARASLRLDGLLPGAPLVVDLLPGEIHPERLAADLTWCGRPPRWARLAPYDLDPAALDAVATVMSGPATGGEHLRPIVVESGDRRQAERFVARVTAHERDGTGPYTVILRYRRTGRPHLIHPPVRRHTKHHAALGNPALTHLVDGRLALYDAILDAGRRLRPGELNATIQQSRTLDDLTARLTGRLLRDVPEPTRTLLGFAAILGYCHPRYRSFEPVLESCGYLPWWTELGDDWRRFEPAWRSGVLAVCGSDHRPRVTLLGQLVSELVDDGAGAAAIEMSLDAGYLGTASDLIAGLGPDLVAAGRPRCVRHWLRRLPWAVRRRHGPLAAQVRQAWRAARATPPADPGPVPVPATRPEPSRVPVAPATGPDPVSPLLMRARLLGPVEITIGGHRVERWHGRKGLQMLAYLLLRDRDRPVTRDCLAATFWPDASPDASRNRLHVTLHTLRSDLQTASDVPVVLFNHGYELNPGLIIRLDTEEFDRAVARGERSEKDDDVDAALRAYREAAHVYRGDLLCDHPYDDWTVLPREHYRTRMLDVLDRAARLAFDAGRYTESVETAQRLLALDFCREDLHRLLMRAYARLGRPHLALHQFEICSRQLRQELDVAPAPETVDLYDLIRSRAPV